MRHLLGLLSFDVLGFQNARINSRITTGFIDFGHVEEIAEQVVSS